MTAGHGIGPETVAAHLDRLDRADQAGAVRLAAELLVAGCSVADVLVDLVAVAQREIGRRWLAGAWGGTARDAVRLLDRQLLTSANTGPSAEPPDDEYVAVLHRRREIVQLAPGAGGALLDAVLASCETALSEPPRACQYLRLARSTAGPA